MSVIDPFNLSLPLYVRSHNSRAFPRSHAFVKEPFLNDIYMYVESLDKFFLICVCI